jgi:mono/diheme cytochrome c family protein
MNQLMHPIKRLFIAVLFASLLIACEENQTDSQVSSQTLVKTGEALFQQTQLKHPSTTEQALGCIVCHRLDGEAAVAPSLVGIGTRAKVIIEGMTASDYLRESIVNPDAHIVTMYEPSIMPNNYAQVLSDDDINALIAYLLTL